MWNITPNKQRKKRQMMMMNRSRRLKFNGQMTMNKEEIKKIGKKIIDGFHDVLERADTGDGIPVTLLASIYAAEINLIARKEPKFYKMVLVACDRQLSAQAAQEDAVIE